MGVDQSTDTLTLTYTFTYPHPHTPTPSRTLTDTLTLKIVVGIVGPVKSSESHVVAPFTEKVAIPMISHAARDSKLPDR